MAITTLIHAGRGDFHIRYLGKTVDDLIIEYMEQNNIPSLTLAIVQAPYITHVVGYGLADKKTKQLAAMHTVYAIGQMTNAFTAVAIMQLKEEGKLSLDTRITQYFDTVPQWNTITIRDLLTHSSGIPDYTHNKNFDYRNEYTFEDILALVKNQELLFEPGTDAQYSATNSYILGIIIEQVSGTSYEEYITKNQIERVGLKNTFFISNKDTIKNEIHFGDTTKPPFKHNKFLHTAAFVNPIELATGYTQTDNELIPSKEITWSSTFASSGIIASAQDISLWDISLAGDILVKDSKDRDFLYKPVTLKNGKVIPGNIGWFFPGHKGLMEIKGNIPGYSVFLSRFTDASELLCVTLLVNKGDIPDLDILARKIAGAFDSTLAAPHGSAWSVTMQSPYSVEKTINRVSDFIKAHGGTVFAHIDHALEAKKVNLSLQPTQVLIIGNPAQGTAMMQANQTIALDLPLKIMATQDTMGQVWLSFTDPVALAQHYGQPDQKQIQLLKKIYSALLKACQKAISPY